jgi:beta-lactamase class A
MGCRRKIGCLIFLLIFLAVLSFLGILKITVEVNLPKPIASRLGQTNQPAVLKDQKTISTEIKEKIDQAEGSWSFYFFDLNSHQGFGINESTISTTASVNKVPILASLYYLAGKGEIDLEKQITLQKKDIQDYGTGSIRYDPIGSTYTLKTLARLMMEKSDNTAAYILANHIIGMDKIQEFASSWGLTQTDIKNDQSSLLDMTKLFTKIYRQEITTPALTQEMLGFMDDSDFEDRLPRLLPKEVRVYHKTGDAIGFIHDVGIVDLEKRPYFIGVFTIDIKDEELTKKTIGEISKIVFDWQKGL